MKKKDSKLESVENLSALCNIIDEFEQFKIDLDKLLLSYSITYIENQLQKLMNTYETSFFIPKKIKDFFNRNRMILIEIYRYSRLAEFYCGEYGNKMKKNLMFFYQYFLDNNQNLNKIIVLLHKMRKLGLSTIIFNESFDFSASEYVAIDNDGDLDFSYLENMEAIPNYNYKSSIKYKTITSSYELILYAQRYYDGLYIDTSLIMVNNLLFSPSKLPNNLDDTTNEILNMRSEQMEEACKAINHLIDLSVCVDDLSAQTLLLEKIINQIHEDEELNKALLLVKSALVQMRDASDKYNGKICEKIPLVTPSIIEYEKELYKKSLKK